MRLLVSLSRPNRSSSSSCVVQLTHCSHQACACCRQQLLCLVEVCFWTQGLHFLVGPTDQNIAGLRQVLRLALIVSLGGTSHWYCLRCYAQRSDDRLAGKTGAFMGLFVLSVLCIHSQHFISCNTNVHGHTPATENNNSSSSSGSVCFDTSSPPSLSTCCLLCGCASTAYQ